MAPVADTVRRTTLPNGLRIVTQRVPGVLSAALGLHVLAGPRHETPECRGATHFIEHMLFKGTHRRSALDIAVAMDAVGGSLNAFTEREVTSVQARVMGEHVPLAADVVCDMVASPAFDPAEVEREREVVIQEIKQYEDDAEEMAHDLLARSVWADHPLAASLMGGEAQVRSLSRDRLADYYRERYLPANTVVAAAGQVDHRRIVDLFAPALSDDGQAPADPPSPPPSGAGRRVVSRPGEQVHFCLGGPAFPQRDERTYAVWLLDKAIGAGMSSRLFQEVREARGLVYNIGSYAAGYRDAGLFAAYGATTPDRLETVVDLVRGELGRVREEGIGEDELGRAKAQVKAGVAMALESMSYRATHAAMCEIYWGRHVPAAEVVARIEAVTRDETAQVAYRMLDPGALAYAAVGPEQEEATP